MTTTLTRSAILTATLLSLFAGRSTAQEMITARIPFSFTVGNQQFPAGRYEFTETQSLLTMRGRDNGEAMFALTLPADGRDPQGDEPVLVFTRYENTYRLAEIWNSEIVGSALMPQHNGGVEHRVAADDDTIVIAANSIE